MDSSRYLQNMSTDIRYLDHHDEEMSNYLAANESQIPVGQYKMAPFDIMNHY